MMLGIVIVMVVVLIWGISWDKFFKGGHTQDEYGVESAVSPSVRWAVIVIHCDLLRKTKKSKEAEAQVKEYCKLHMDQMTCVELYP